jgi:hypothetical protein
MMALNPELAQLNKILAVSQARTRRMELGVEMAAANLRAAEDLLDQANEASERATSILSEARRELSKSPGTEQHRLWREKCTLDLAQAKQYAETALDDVALAKEELLRANHALTRQKLRHERLMETRQTLSRTVARKAESRAEDDTSHITAPSLILSGVAP